MIKIFLGSSKKFGFLDVLSLYILVGGTQCCRTFKGAQIINKKFHVEYYYLLQKACFVSNFLSFVKTLTTQRLVS